MAIDKIIKFVNFEIIIALAGIIGSFLLAKAAYFIINKYVKRLTKKTKTDLDDKLLVVLEGPFVAAVMIVGIYLSLIQIDFLRKNIIPLNNLVFIVGVVWSIYVAHKLTNFAMHRWILAHPDFRNMPKLLVKATNAFVYLIGIIITLKQFNVEITPLVATLGIGGIAVGFALAGYFVKFFCRAAHCI